MLSKKKKKGAPEINTASTADISFLLLIFFIVSTVFNVDQGLPLVLPSGEASDAAQVSRKNILEIKAMADNTITVKGNVVRLDRIRQMVQEAQNANPKLIVVVQTAPLAQYGLMINILDELKMAHIKKISIKMLDS
ncbi:MAG: biopolymer transporter ExbD [bacterium]|nr:biopolymer transporter ExbD [bacterium]